MFIGWAMKTLRSITFRTSQECSTPATRRTDHSTHHRATIWASRTHIWEIWLVFQSPKPHPTVPPPPPLLMIPKLGTMDSSGLMDADSKRVEAPSTCSQGTNLNTRGITKLHSLKNSSEVLEFLMLVVERDMAREYPKSHFTGIDVADVFKDTLTPLNCQFLLANTLEGLPFPDNHFDFVFQRLHIFCFTKEGWRSAITELLRVLKPGGTLELSTWVCDCGVDWSAVGFIQLTAWTATATFTTLDRLPRSSRTSVISVTLGMRGIDPCMSSKLKSVLKEFGLTDIKHDHRNLPLGWGPEKIGPPFKTNVMSTIRSCKPQMSVVLGQTEESLEEMISAAEQEMGGGYQCYMTFDSYVVKKPDITGMEALPKFSNIIE
ncbi:hypothetical protein BC937DRAFT_91945 [Endogone sp. FLAS-F59071]|nr:hypothetical protein BC937DRAFT_91945 [Endogone sp. FLAS-F59071]|eukprot:RUS21653.1 hypothetical protein BC937DRAFT_91945 [Endogone sp. FLAS-F59071]